MTENVGHLSDVQRKALEALANGGNKDQAAAVAGRTRRTLDRWIQGDPAFQDAVKQSTDAAVLDAGWQLALLLETAIQAIGDIVTGKDATDAAKLRAADLIISNLVKLREFAELEARISALEEKLI